MRELARLGGAERVAVNDRPPADRVHVRFRKRPPAAADRKEHWPRQLARKTFPQDFVDLPLRRETPSDSIASTGRAPSGILTQRSPTRSSIASATSRLPPPMSPTVPTGRKKPEITPKVANRASSAPLRIRTFRPASASMASASFGPFEARRMASVATASISADAHGLGNGAKSPHGLDRSTKMVRRDCAALG